MSQSKQGTLSPAFIRLANKQPAYQNLAGILQRHLMVSVEQFVITCKTSMRSLANLWTSVVGRTKKELDDLKDSVAFLTGPQSVSTKANIELRHDQSLPLSLIGLKSAEANFSR
ncbi:MAG: hypothetical protein AAF066_11430 [Pseudomonadota bacterium]